MSPRSRGYNHDVRYRGEVFHIQSEVCGTREQQVRTQLFWRGAVLATERKPVGEATDDAVVESLLRAQHKALLHELCNGTFDAWLAQGAAEERFSHPAPSATGFNVQMRRRGVVLDVRGRDFRERCELAIEVCNGADILAVRRVGYEAHEDATTIDALLQAEVDAMVAKVRRGGLDARLPGPSFVFVPPTILPTR